MSNTQSPFKFAMFWGCTIPYRLPFIEQAIRKVFAVLDIKYQDLGFSCCPDPNGIKSFDLVSWVALAVRNITLAESEGLNIVSACNGCFETLKLAHYHMTKNKELRKKVNQILQETTGRQWTGQAQIIHLIDYLYEYVDFDKLSSKLVYKLDNLAVTIHNGCHYLKPSDVLNTDNPFYPLKLKTILEDVLGATVLPYIGETDCCGAGLRNIENSVALEMAHRKFNNMDRVQPDSLVVICPTCFNSFDAQQRIINRTYNRSNQLPVFHLFELLALALGIPAEEMGLKFHSIKPKSDLLNKIQPQLINTIMES